MKKTQPAKAVPTFSRWSRKSYGVFASLGRQVRIGVLSTSMLLVSFDALSEEADSTRLVRIEAISVSSTRVAASPGALDAPRVAADPLIIENAPLQSIESALRTLPFADVRSRGARGVQSDISLRAGNFDQTSILLNGVNFTDPRTGHQSHSLPIALSSINSVNYLSHHIAVGSYTGALDYRVGEVNRPFFRGGVTAGGFGTYSIEASGGVKIPLDGTLPEEVIKNITNEVTKEIDNPLLKNLAREVASGLTRKFVKAPQKSLSFFASAAYDHSDGYTANTDYNRLNLYTRTQYTNKNQTIDFQLGFQSMDFGSNSFYSLAYPDQWEATKTALTSLRYSNRWGKWSFEAVASYRLNTDRFELFRPGKTTAADWYTGGNYHLTDNVGVAASAGYYWGAGGTTSIGVDYAYNHIWSTVLGEKLDTHKVIGAQSYNYAKDRNSASYWLRHFVVLGDFDLSAVASLAQNSFSTEPLGGVSVGYTFLRGFRAQLAAARTMRLPTFTDLYYTTATHIGNPNLVPETAFTYSATLSFERKRWSAVASTYYRDGSNIIDWVQQPDDALWHSMQITKLGTLGVEAALSYHPERGFVQLLSASYGYTNVTKSSGDYVSRYALDYMKHKASAQGQFRLVRDKLILAVTGTFYDRNGEYQSAPNEPLQNFKPYFLLDSRLTWNFSKFSLWGECSNILDTKYFDFGGIIMPSRWLMAGISVRL